MSQGYENSTSLNEDNSIIKKTYKHESNMLSELKALEFLKSYKENFPTILSQDSLILSFNFIQGKHPDKDDIQNPAFIKALVTTLCLVHKNRFSAVGPILRPTPLKEISWTDYLVKKTSGRIDEASTLPIKKRRILDQIMALSNLEYTNLVHHDLKPANIIYSNKDNRAYLIDFEKASFGSYLLDLAKLKWRMFFNNNIEWDYFIAEYHKEFIGHEPSTKIKEDINTYEALHCIGAVAYYHHTKNEQYKMHYTSACQILERKQLL